MSSKYLGETFDIHGGGMDLQFPHHESEIAQSTVAHGHPPVRYWMHNNMITINGKKMGKSYNNVIKLSELFSGKHDMLAQAYHPMVVRFYILQTHYRSTLDFSNDALQASERAFRRLWEAYEVLQKLELPKNEEEISEHIDYVLNKMLTQDNRDFRALQSYADKGIFQNINFTKVDGLFVDSLLDICNIIERTQSQPSDGVGLRNQIFSNFNVIKKCLECDLFMKDDFNTAKVIANLFELAPIINGIKSGQINIDFYYPQVIGLLKNTFKTYLEDILGMQPMQVQEGGHVDKVMRLLIDIRKDARTRKDFATSDQIRNKLAEAGIQLKDEKDGSVSYTIE
jgi:cysteinyl-tRNA synthetase